MQDRHGKWVGYAASAFCFGLVLLTILTARYHWEILEFSFAGLCHQIDNRCYQIAGVSLPVCVRCLWIYLGLAMGHLVFTHWNPETSRITRALIGVIALMVLDVLFEFAGLYDNWFWSRAITGFLFGLIVSRFTLLGLRELSNELTNPIIYVRSKFSSSRTR